MPETPNDSRGSGRARRTGAFPRLDRFEMIVLAVFLLGGGMLAWVSIARGPHPEHLPEYRARYGQVVASHGPEEWLARDFFDDERGGVFVDVGSGPAMHGSNTYVLETHLGWSGLAIDAQADYGPEYHTLRPRTRFVTAFVDARDGQPAELWIVPHRPESSSRDRAFARFYAGWRGEPVRATFTTTTLNTLLNSQGIGRIDYLNMDIELSEPQALAGFDITRYQPRLVSVEMHGPTEQAILDYFAEHRYVVIAKYLRDDPTNLWFRPLARAQGTNPANSP